MSSEIDKNVCEICGQKAIDIILDNYDNNNMIILIKPE